MHEANGGRSEEAVLAEWASVQFVEVDRGPNADSILETALNEVAWGEEGEMLGEQQEQAKKDARLEFVLV